jgi:hypothetical protein
LRQDALHLHLTQFQRLEEKKKDFQNKGIFKKRIGLLRDSRENIEGVVARITTFDCTRRSPCPTSPSSDDLCTLRWTSSNRVSASLFLVGTSRSPYPSKKTKRKKKKTKGKEKKG